MASDMQIAIGVDVGATKIASALVRQDGHVLATRQTATLVQEGAAAVIARIARDVDALRAASPSAVRGVGIGVPGLVNPVQGVVLQAVNMEWLNVALAEMVQARLSAPLTVRVENDVRGAAQGEFLFGAARGISDFVLLTIGSGLGSAAVVNGNVIRGAKYFASEAGHLVIDPRGFVCTCGLRGCAETVLSGRGLIETTREFLQTGLASDLDANALTTNVILDAARANDPVAFAAMEKMGEWLGIVMATASAWLNPARIILGGGLGSAAFDLLQAPARESYAQRVLRGSQSGVELVRSQVESSAVGAAALALAER